MKSQLEPDIYGPPESAITDEIVERQIKGVMTLEEAVKQKKLYILDYHDLLLPYVAKDFGFGRLAKLMFLLMILATTSSLVTGLEHIVV